MIYHLADNIISPLGDSTQANVEAVRRGASALRRYEGLWGLPEPFVASLFSLEQRSSFFADGLTFFESLAAASIQKAVDASGVDVSSPRTILILSTTKGNVELLDSSMSSAAESSPSAAAKHIARHLHFVSDPIVVCNACVSGLSAIILAQRLLDGGLYDHAVVCGADVQCPFVVSGFQSFKALSVEPCRPFDIDRLGLNLGEAAASIVFGRRPAEEGQWVVADGCLRNDAVHISNPSNKGEGLWRALAHLMSSDAVPDASSLGFVNAHGTGTMFNDQMEAAALRRSGLSALPVNALKGYYGHTMGAAGIVETIVSMRAADEGWIAATKGFAELGVSGDIKVADQELPFAAAGFIKMLSGFGGCNAAIAAVKKHSAADDKKQSCGWRRKSSVVISPSGALLNGCRLETAQIGDALLTEIYRRYTPDYPKFHKMDMLSRLGYVASELLIIDEGGERFAASEDRAVIFFNNSSSVHTDKRYLKTIESPDSFYPSPSLFVYTLPNIVTGEIALRNHYHGETSFYLLGQYEPSKIDALLPIVVDNSTASVIGGWLDYADSADFLAEISIFEKDI